MARLASKMVSRTSLMLCRRTRIQSLTGSARTWLLAARASLIRWITGQVRRSSA
jgi:hypothetical protein